MRQASCEKLHFDEHKTFGSLCFLELHLTVEQMQQAAAGQTLAPIPQGQDVLIVIGEGLDRARIETQLHR